MEEMYYRMKSYVLQGVALLLELAGAASAWLQKIAGTAAEKTKDCAYAAEQEMLARGAQVVEKVKETGAQARDYAVSAGEKVKEFYKANKKAILITMAAVSAVLAAVAVLCCVMKCRKED